MAPGACRGPGSGTAPIGWTGFGTTCLGDAVPAATGDAAGINDATDDVALARRARTTLCAAEHGRLVVAGARWRAGGEAVVSVRDDGGEPTMVLPAPDLVEDAAVPRRHAALLLDADPEFGVGVTLVGRLVPSPGTAHGAARGPGRDPSQVVALAVERVLVSCPYDPVAVTTRARRPIPLDLYALAEPDRTAVEIARMIPHLNREHGADVRALAAFCAGRPVGEVLAAELNHLCRNGFGLNWVGVDGADEVRHRFAEPARDVAGIGRRLQGYVAAVR